MTGWPHHPNLRAGGRWGGEPAHFYDAYCQGLGHITAMMLSPQPTALVSLGCAAQTNLKIKQPKAKYKEGKTGEGAVLIGPKAKA